MEILHPTGMLVQFIPVVHVESLGLQQVAADRRLCKRLKTLMIH